MRTRLRLALPLLALAGTLPAARATTFLAPGGLNVRLPVTSMYERRNAGTVLQQYDFSCGSAAIATLLTHHYGRAVGEQEVLREMYARGDQEKIRKEGFSMLDMKRYLQGLGYEADGFQQPLDKLAAARLPAIALINESNYHHFVVIKGLKDGYVLFGDPARGIRSVRRADFEAAWVGGMLFVIHNRVKEARFNLAADWRAAPRAPLASGIPLDSVGSALPKHGPGDF